MVNPAYYGALNSAITGNAASQIVEARDHGLMTSRLMTAMPYEILAFIRRGTSVENYDRLKAALVVLSQKVACFDVENQLFEKIQDWRARC